jgi:MYXO-CTERM domain-containing protein
LIDRPRSLICAGALVALLMASCPALAEGGNHWGWGNGNSGGGVSRSAPGPELGAGLPALILGGYLWYRRRSKQSPK